MMVTSAQSRAGIFTIKDRDTKRIVNELQRSVFDTGNIRRAVQLKKELYEKYPDVVEEIKEKDPLFFQDIERIIIRSKTGTKI